jgi:hypothetical protein
MASVVLAKRLLSSLPRALGHREAAFRGRAVLRSRSVRWALPSPAPDPPADERRDGRDSRAGADPEDRYRLPTLDGNGG